MQAITFIAASIGVTLSLQQAEGSEIQRYGPTDLPEPPSYIT
jgi:hypothetical protein